MPPGRTSTACLSVAAGRLAVDDLEEVAVQVNGVRHHRVVDQAQPHPLVAREADRLGTSLNRSPSNDHMKRSMLPVRVDLDGARRRPGSGSGQGHEIAIGQDPVLDMLEPGAAVAGAVDRHRRDHVDARSEPDLGRVGGIAHVRSMPDMDVSAGGAERRRPAPHGPSPPSRRDPCPLRPCPCRAW